MRLKVILRGEAITTTQETGNSKLVEVEMFVRQTDRATAHSLPHPTSIECRPSLQQEGKLLHLTSTHEQGFHPD